MLYGDVSICSTFVIAIWLSHGQLRAFSRESYTNPMLITAFAHVRPEDHREPHNKVGSLSLTECLVRFEPGTSRFYLQHLNPLGHSGTGSTGRFRTLSNIHR